MIDDKDNIVALRKRTLNNTRMLELGQMDLATASIISKNNEIVINTLKIELLYAKARDEIPDIDFIKGENDINSYVVIPRIEPKRSKDK